MLGIGGAGTQAQDGNGAVNNPPTVAPDNMAPAPGFTVRPQGQVYGPYVEVGRFQVKQDLGGDPYGGVGGGPTTTTETWYFADRYGHPILYFPANLNGNIFAGGSGWGGYVDNWTSGSPNPQPMFNFADNKNALTTLGLPPAAPPGGNAVAMASMRVLLGNRAADGKINSGESASTRKGYILWSAGPDEHFGVDTSGYTPGGDTSLLGNRVPGCDDALSWTP